MHDLNKNKKMFRQHPKDTSNLSVNQAVIARFSQDGFWYRAKIVDVKTPEIVKVSMTNYNSLF